MTRLSFFSISLSWRKSTAFILACVLLLGQLLGIWSSSNAGEVLGFGVRRAADIPATVAGSLTVSVLPFLFSMWAVYLKCPLLLLPIAFVKAFFFSYVGYGILLTCGSVGWLIAALEMFSSLLSLGALCWFWYLHLCGREFSASLCCLIFGVLLLIAVLDFVFISPFLVNILIL